MPLFQEFVIGDPIQAKVNQYHQLAEVFNNRVTDQENLLPPLILVTDRQPDNQQTITQQSPGHHNQGKK